MSLPSSRTMPVVPGRPLIGNLPDLMTPRLRPFLTRHYRTYGPVFQVSALGQRFTALAGPEANLFTMKEGHQVLRSEEAWRPNDLEMGVRQSLISVDGEAHRHYRRVEGPSYARSAFVAGLPRALSVTAEDLAPFRAGDALPVAHWCKNVITEQLARLVVNGTARPHMADMLHFVQTALMVTVTRQQPRVMLALPGYRRSKAAISTMVDGLIDAHRRTPPAEAGREPDLVDSVLAAARERPDLWSPPDQRMAVMGAFIAGMDTAANSMAFILYRMHRHPEFLPALRAEADALFRDGPPDAEALGRSPLLHRFVMETLRLHPIAPALTRTLTQDVTFAGHDLRAGTTVIIGMTVSHGLERFYPEPERFDPDRFSRERAEHRQPGAYAPFGVGAHTCAGSGMAEGLMMLNAAALLRTLDLSLDPGYRLHEVARPTPSPDDRLGLRVEGVRHDAVSLLA